MKKVESNTPWECTKALDPDWECTKALAPVALEYPEDIKQHLENARYCLAKIDNCSTVAVAMLRVLAEMAKASIVPDNTFSDGEYAAWEVLCKFVRPN